MGLFDACCMLTGVSLKGADAAAVAIESVGENFRPMTLAVFGHYNRVGTVDGVKNDANTKLIMKYFEKKLDSGEFESEEYGAGHIELLLESFERNINDGPCYALLNELPVYASLISKAVWKAIANSVPPISDSPDECYDQIFPEGSIGREIYGGKRGNIGTQLREFSSILNFMTEQKMVWKVTEGGGQDYAESMRQALKKARNKFQAVPAILDGLRDYEIEVADLLVDSEV